VCKRLLVEKEVSGRIPADKHRIQRLSYRRGDRYDKSIVSLMMIGGVYDEKESSQFAVLSSELGTHFRSGTVNYEL
jgi:hypothetical protein